MGRVLGYTVPIYDDEQNVVGRTIPAGTREEDIDAADLERILDVAWGPSPVIDEADRVDAGIAVDEGEDVPQSLDDCTVAQLKEIAKRGVDGEPIHLGRVTRREDMIEVLRAAGIDDGGS